MFSQVHLIFNHLRFQGEFWKAMSKNWSLHPCEALTGASKPRTCSALKTEVAMFFFPGQVWKSYAACWHAELAMLASWGGYTHWIFFMLAISQVHSEMTASQCKEFQPVWTSSFAISMRPNTHKLGLWLGRPYCWLKKHQETLGVCRVWCYGSSILECLASQAR